MALDWPAPSGNAQVSNPQALNAILLGGGLQNAETIDRPAHAQRHSRPQRTGATNVQEKKQIALRAGNELDF